MCSIWQPFRPLLFGLRTTTRGGTPPSSPLHQSGIAAAVRRHATTVADRIRLAHKTERQRLRSRLRQLREQERLHRLRQSRQQQQNAENATTAEALSRFLPRNDALEAAMGRWLRSRGDAPSMLSLAGRLRDSTILSLSSTHMQHWDPWDVKPQLFALGKYLALPAFTSIDTMRVFADKHNLTIRGPDHALWVAPGADSGGVARSRVAREDVDSTVVGSGRRRTRRRKQNAQAARPRGQHTRQMKNRPPLDEQNGGHVTPDGMADGAFSSNSKHEQGKEEKERKSSRWSGNKERQRRSAPRGSASTASRCDDASLAVIPSFELSTAVPLPYFGLPRVNFCLGYFAPFDTFVHNLTVVPEKCNIVFNPNTPLEMVLTRPLVDELLLDQDLRRRQYANIERMVRAEFFSFFGRYCPEVSRAWTAVLPRLAHPGQPLHEAGSDVLVCVDTANEAATWDAMARAKRSGHLKGHADLTVLPSAACPPHARDALATFFDREAVVGQMLAFHHRSSHAPSQPSGVGALRPVGRASLVNAHLSPLDYYRDPSLAT